MTQLAFGLCRVRKIVVHRETECNKFEQALALLGIFHGRRQVVTSGICSGTRKIWSKGPDPTHALKTGLDEQGGNAI